MESGVVLMEDAIFSDWSVLDAFYELLPPIGPNLVKTLAQIWSKIGPNLVKKFGTNLVKNIGQNLEESFSFFLALK